MSEAINYGQLLINKVWLGAHPEYTKKPEMVLCLFGFFWLLYKIGQRRSRWPCQKSMKRKILD